MTIVTNRNGIAFDIDDIATDLNGKADVDLMNVNERGTERAARWLIPSDVVIDLVTGPNGTQYTAPATGWFWASSSAAGNHLSLLNRRNGMVIEQYNKESTSGTESMYIPVLKGDIVSLFLSTSEDVNVKFYYAEGAKSEAE